MKVRQYVSSVIAAAALSLAAVTGCTPSGVQIDGETVSNGDAVVSAALALLKADNAGALRNRTSTIAESTQCFFVKAGPEVDGVTPAVACGPIRRVGLPEAAVWDVYPLKLSQDSGGRTTAHLAEDASPETGTEVAADLLVSPSGAEPAAFDAAPEPVAPQSSAKNVALALGKDSPPVEADFRPLGKPSTLITPAVDVTVTGVAELDLVPAALEVGGEASESDVPHFRPADGQRVIAIMIKLGPSTMTTAPAQTGWGESATLVSLDTTIMLHTDDVTIPLRGVTDGQSTAYTITCAETPCTSVTETAEVTVLASVPSSGPVRLATQTNGAAQFIDLQTGARSGKVSTVDYDRTEQAIEVNKTVTTKLTRKGYFDDADCEWAVTVERVTLGAFDGRLGWATPGKAWLAIQAELDDSSGHCYSFDTSPVSSLVALQVGKKPAKVAFASKSLFVFEVDHAVTTSSFSYTPRGRFTGSATDSDFVAKPATISFAFRK